MADEIRFACELGVINGSLVGSQSTSGNADQTTPGLLQRTQTVNTTGAALTLTGLTASKYIQIVNSGANNTVDVGPDSTGIIPLATLAPGDVMQFPRKSSATVRVVANANTATISITATET
jgi:hypothetical protein